MEYVDFEKIKKEIHKTIDEQLLTLENMVDYYRGRWTASDSDVRFLLAIIDDKLPANSICSKTWEIVRKAAERAEFEMKGIERKS